ncbi:MAG: hypothetical protein AAFO91_02005 [Bacteroidota bacterium]
MAVDLTALNTAMGAYARQNSGEIIRALIAMKGQTPDQPIDIFRTMSPKFLVDEESFARVRPNVQVRERDSQVVSQDDASMIFTGAIRKIRYMEHIDEVNPDDFNTTWMEETTPRPRVQIEPRFEDMPFASWFVTYLMEAFMSGLYRQSFVKAEYSAGFGYADSWLSAFDGVIATIRSLITGGSITNVVATGATTSSNAYANVEAMCKAVPNYMHGMPLWFVMPQDIYDFYNDDYHNVFGTAPLQNDEYKRTRSKSRERIVFVPEEDLNGTQLMYITTDGNVREQHDIRGQRNGRIEPQFSSTVLNVKQIQYRVQHGAGISVDDPRNIVVNDQATVV